MRKEEVEDIFKALQREVKRLPDSHGKSMALTHVADAMFWVNAAITRSRLDSPDASKA